MMPLFRHRSSQEEGVVLVTVLLVTFVLLILVAGTMAYAVGSQPLSRRDQDWNAALSAAEAGLDDYLYRLNQNDQYYLYGQPTAVAPCNMALTAPPDGNLAFTQFVPVPGATSNATFRYCVDTQYLSQGAIVVWSSGKAANVTRTVQATFRRRAFIDYLYFTDYETTDPAAYPVSGVNNNDDTWAQTNCAMHWYDPGDPPTRVGGPPYDNSHCVDINFVSGDVINGPLHSNDAIMTCGSPTFNGKVTTSWQGPARRSSGIARTPAGAAGTRRSPTAAIRSTRSAARCLPSNLAIKVKADKSLGGAGCLFTGPTSITLNAAGTMTVVSPFTKASAVSTNNCAGGTLASPATQSLPANGVIYVQSVPADPTDPNYTSTCPNVQELGAPAGTTVQHPLGPAAIRHHQYGCTDGDVFLEGTLKGRLTIAADNNIDVTGNLTYNGGSAAATSSAWWRTTTSRSTTRSAIAGRAARRVTTGAR